VASRASIDKLFLLETKTSERIEKSLKWKDHSTDPEYELSIRQNNSPKV